MIALLGPDNFKGRAKLGVDFYVAHNSLILQDIFHSAKYVRIRADGKIILLAEAGTERRCLGAFSGVKSKKKLGINRNKRLRERMQAREVRMPTITVKGMSCGHCVSAVTKAVAGVPGTADVAVDLQKGEASWKDADAAKPASVEAVKQAIRAVGFEA